MSDAAQDYWERRREELSIRPKGADEIDTRFRRELEALAHQMAEFCHPYDDPLVSVAYAIARALDLPNWSAAHAEIDERDDAAIAAASVVKSLRLATRTAPMSAQPSRSQIRDVFLANGFTVKQGQTDLKEYVYNAAHALLVLAAGPQPKAEKNEKD